MIQDLTTICRVLFEAAKMVFGLFLFLLFQGICFIFLACFEFFKKIFAKIFKGFKL